MNVMCIVTSFEYFFFEFLVMKKEQEGTLVNKNNLVEAWKGI